MNWLREHMREHIAVGRSVNSDQPVVSYPRPLTVTADCPETDALNLIRQAAALLRQSESHSAEVESRARDLADRAAAELKFAKRKIQSLEADCEKLNSLVAEAANRAVRAEEALQKSEDRLGDMEAIIAASDMRTKSAEARTREVEDMLLRVENAIRTEILDLPQPELRTLNAA